MIPVQLQPEPVDFENLVSKPGWKWIRKSGLDPSQPVPIKTNIPPHWRKCLPQLHKAYGGICAYLSIFVELDLTGNPSVDHFVPKSRRLDKTFAWDNFRFACSTMNSRKNDYEDVLDPFTLEPNLFVLNLLDGGLDPHPNLAGDKLSAVILTIKRLGLDDAECRDKRLAYIDGWRCNQRDRDEGIPTGQLERCAPFVYLEMKRQKLL